MVVQIMEQEPGGWASLPRDVAWEIFRRLRHVDILRGAGLACASWRRLAADEPALWRSIDVAFDKDDDRSTIDQRLAMGRAALDRSAGRCEAPSLRSLHVTSPWCLPDAYMDSVITKLPMLEQLVLTGGLLLTSTLRALLKHCPRLKMLDAGDCNIDQDVSYRLWRKCGRTIKVLDLPRKVFFYCQDLPTGTQSKRTNSQPAR
ncbi:hypothetical protein HU200_061848 [Digitaria exilis]|uniref:F-box domain-containing protein n=1 Tax=Digitaria exilis TaxID=1010633 RepID=A0A835AB54_9POAL|nr:hypothetical protein HU200_061848 [Digitaria exilis]